MKTKYITVLDFEVGEVFQYESPENIETRDEYKYLKKHGKEKYHKPALG